MIERDVEIQFSFGTCFAFRAILFLFWICKFEGRRSANFLNCIKPLWWLSICFSQNTAGITVLFLFHELINSFQVRILSVLIWVIVVSNTYFTNDLSEHSLIMSSWAGSQFRRNAVYFVAGFLHDMFLRFYIASVRLPWRLVESLIPLRIGSFWFLLILNGKALNYFRLLIFTEDTFSLEVLFSIIMGLTQTLFIGYCVMIAGKLRHEFRRLLWVFFYLFGFPDDFKGLLRLFDFSGINDSSFWCFLEELVDFLSDFFLLFD